ncbi:carboxymethylenebutenolidase [Malassezia yamatoensis]|uniref:Carboxymethylenebutenolidase n=1 Tax=Malassezia yamatoensis TaxID=253288 RepID=A0AAJ5YXN4_9BASI|nr:carboxymethylenebutenolidase [Malassezia yamatoensis]
MTQLSTPECCTVPPIESRYTPKGITQEVNGVICYVVGDQTATRAIVAIYDIFGFHSSSEQGADILAALTGCRVYIPDLFDGKPLPLDTIPADTQEKQTRMSSCKTRATDQVFTGLGNPIHYSELLTSFGRYLISQGFASVGLYGLCWGSKPAAIVSSDGTPYSALVLIHPSLLEPEDAKKIAIPTANFTSSQEDNDVIRAFNAEAKSNPSIGSTFITYHYPDAHHGFAGARANLDDNSLRASFQDVYQRTAKFLLQHLA